MHIQSLFRLVLSVSFMGSIAAVIVLLIKLTFKNKLSAKWQYYICLLVIFRLMLPYMPGSSFSIFNFVNNPAQVKTAAANSNSNSNQSVNQLNETVNTNESTASTTNINKNINKTDQKTANIKNNVITNKFSYKSIVNEQNLSIVWLIGVMIFLCYVFISYLVFKIKISKEAVCTDEIINSIMKKYKKSMKIKLTGMVSKKAYVPLTAAIVNKSKIKGRIIMITKFKRKPFWCSIIAVVVALLVVTVCLTNGKKQDVKLTGDKNKVSDVKKQSDNNAKVSSAANTTNTANKANTTNTTNTIAEKKSQVQGYSSYKGIWICSKNGNTEDEVFKNGGTIIKIKAVNGNNLSGTIITASALSKNSNTAEIDFNGTVVNNKLSFSFDNDNNYRNSGSVIITFENNKVTADISTKMNITTWCLGNGKYEFVKDNSSDNNRQDYVYTNSKLGFSITIPEWWKDKYTIKEDKTEISFYFKPQTKGDAGS